MSDKYDAMSLEDLQREAVRRVPQHGHGNYAISHVDSDAMSTITLMGEARGNALYKCGCTLTAYPHDDCYSCEFYKCKNGYETRDLPDFRECIAGAASSSGDCEGGLPRVIFIAALRALDWDATQEKR